MKVRCETSCRGARLGTVCGSECSVASAPSVYARARSSKLRAVSRKNAYPAPGASTAPRPSRSGHARVGLGPEDPLLAAAVEDVGEEVAIHAVQLVHVPDEVVGMLFVAQEQAHDELDRVEVLGDERVVLVDQALDLIDLGEPLEVVDDVDEVRLERPLQRRAKELVLVLEVPEDESLRDLRILGDLRERGIGVTLGREQARRARQDLFARISAGSYGDRIRPFL